MTPYGIARYVGSWVSASGYRLRIKKVRKDQASVEFFDPRGAPLQRHYMGGRRLSDDDRALRRLKLTAAQNALTACYRQLSPRWGVLAGNSAMWHPMLPAQ
jgi:hypothetical protein